MSSISSTWLSIKNPMHILLVLQGFCRISSGALSQHPIVLRYILRSETSILHSLPLSWAKVLILHPLLRSLTQCIARAQLAEISPESFFVHGHLINIVFCQGTYLVFSAANDNVLPALLLEKSLWAAFLYLMYLRGPVGAAGYIAHLCPGSSVPHSCRDCP